MADITDRAYLFECFDLDSRTGALKWKVRPPNHFPTMHGCNIFNAQKAGFRADIIAPNGYRRIRIGETVVLAHRIVFLLHYGYLPKFIDHINGNRADNRPENLREASGSGNSHNTIVHRGTSKYKGVSWNSKAKNWKVYYTDASLGKYSNGKNKQKFAGSFNDEVEAALTYDRHAEAMYGEFAWLNRNNFPEVRKAYEEKIGTVGSL